MINPVKMAKLRLVALQQEKQNALNVLHSYEGVHINEFPFSGLLEKEKQSDTYNEIVSELIKIQGFLSALPKKSSNFSKFSIPVKEALQEVKSLGLGEKLFAFNRELNEIKVAKEKIEQDLKVLSMLKDFHIDFSNLRTNTIDFVLGKYSRLKSFDEISKITKKMEIVSKPFSDSHKIVLIVCQKEFISKVREVLSKNAFEEILLPKIQGTPTGEISKLHSLLGELSERKNIAEKELQKLSDGFYERLLFLKEILEIEKKKMDGFFSFGKSSDVFYLEFFLPEKQVSSFKNYFAKNFSGKHVIQVEGSEHLMHSHENVPTVMNNPALIGPFEFMIRFVSLPKSHEIDPSAIFFWFFPLFYGMMVGDVGYGLIAFILAGVLFLKLPKGNMLKPISAMLAYASIPTVLFGLVFDEFFGFSHHKLLELLGFHDLEFYVGIERLHNIPILIAGTILVGLLTICIGYLFGAWNAWIEKNYKHVIAKLSWVFLLLSGTVLISGSMFGFMTEFLMPSLVVFVVSLIPIVLFEGIIGIIEIPSAIGNILSFVRILAVGLVGVIIAIILNQLLLPSPEQGLMLLITIPLYILGHVANVILAMFESLIQGARLNYVEFFSK
ncbi:MAG: V-type ATPase 116kDa subunit family protein, partial [Candidatus Diapherotrites archaeon]|nr:V-type ATPase 116kDa subunit family protein [Candidatus Diapherotrites archaeon]